MKGVCESCGVYGFEENEYELCSVCIESEENDVEFI
jgi:hypothetical protein